MFREVQSLFCWILALFALLLSAVVEFFPFKHEQTASEKGTDPGLGDGWEREGEGGDGGGEDGEHERAGEEAREGAEAQRDGPLVPQRQHHEVGAQDLRHPWSEDFPFSAGG